MHQRTAESPAYRLVLNIMHIQRAATEECSMQSEGNAVHRVRRMQSEGNAVWNAVCRVRGMQSEGNAELYSGIAGILLSPVYNVHAAHGNRGKQYAERGECSMQNEENAD